MRSTAAKATLAIAALVGVAGCGGPSAEEQRAKRASYERSATRVCAAIAADLKPRREPAGPLALERYVERADDAVRDGAHRLHDLSATFGDSEPSAIADIDDRIDAVVDAVEQLEHATQRLPYTPITQGQADSVSAPAERARRALGSLYRAAKAARLNTCGGGNRLADTVLLALYRDRLGSINTVTIRAYRRLPDVGDAAASRVRVLRTLRINIADLRRLRRLHPPSPLRELHARQVRLDAEVIGIERRQAALFANPTPRNLLEANELVRREVRLLRRGTTVIRRMERIAGVTL